MEERFDVTMPRSEPGLSMYKEPARRFYLEERLRNLKMREDEPFAEFYDTRFGPLKEELADMGRQLDLETEVFLILSSLPDSWSGFVEVVVLLGIDTLSLDDLFTKIEIEELEGSQLRADNQDTINRLGLRKYIQLRDLRAVGKMREESEKASNLSVQDAN